MADNNVKYTEDNIRSLDWKEHIRMRPGMYIGKLGDGSSSDDGIYVLVKEVIDNSIDEFVMGNGKKISIKIDNDIVQVRDKSKKLDLILNSIKMVKGDLNISWLSVDKAKMEGTFVNFPERDEIDLTMNEQLVVEYYSR